jgi:serine/threonine protein kinase
VVDNPTRPYRDSSASEAPGRTASGELPQRLGQFLLYARIGAGGMGVVYRAEHALLGSQAAVKVIRPEHRKNRRLVERFLRELKAAGRLRDTAHVVRATHADEEDGVLYLAMEYVAGLDLGRLLQQTGPLAAADACELIRQAALGLQAIHEAGLVHRDIKPSNLLLSSDGVVKVSDLGLARLREDDQELTGSGCLMGTAGYIAPEQALDPRSVDIRADVYSLGCTLFKLLTGQAPSREEADGAGTAFPSLPAEAGFPLGLNAVLRRMTASGSGQRYDTPREAAEALAPFAAGSDVRKLLPAQERPSSTLLASDSVTKEALSPASATPAPPVPPETELRPVPPARSRRWRIAAAAAAVLVLAVAGVLAFWPRQEPVTDDRPRVFDELAPLQWHDLLDRPPTPVLWIPGDGKSIWVFNKPLQQLNVNTNADSLFQLGETQQGNWKLQVNLVQTRWTGGFGLYLGYRTTDLPVQPPQDDRAIVAQFQFLKLQARPAANGGSTFELQRGIGLVRVNSNNQRAVDTEVRAGQMVEPPESDQTLEVEVVDSALHSVKFGGKALDKLADTRANKKFDRRDYRGGLGFFNSVADATFRQARFLIHQPF